MSHLELLMKHPLKDSDCLFPALSSTGKIKIGESIHRSGIEKMLQQAVDGSGVLAGRRGKYTTHCFRRGGAQYRFMWAQHKWSLKAVKWWGGWSAGEQVKFIPIWI
jgi:hypothetical protein